MIEAILTGFIATVLGGITVHFLIKKKKYNKNSSDNNIQVDMERTLDAKEIITHLDNLPPYQRKNIIKTYQGNIICWDVKFLDVHESAGTKITIMSRHQDEHIFILFDVFLKDYPIFKVAKKETIFVVKGTIIEIDSHTINIDPISIKEKN